MNQAWYAQSKDLLWVWYCIGKLTVSEILLKKDLSKFYSVSESGMGMNERQVLSKPKL